MGGWASHEQEGAIEGIPHGGYKGRPLRATHFLPWDAKRSGATGAVTAESDTVSRSVISRAEAGASAPPLPL